MASSPLKAEIMKTALTVETEAQSDEIASVWPSEMWIAVRI